LTQALKEIPSPPVALSDYLPPHLKLLDKNTTTIPSLLLYLLSIYSKAIINNLVNECAVNIKAAESVGTMVAQVFSMPDLQFQRNVPSIQSGIHYDAFGGTAPTPPLKPSSVSLITILMCKFHATAPMLFGISGSEKTAAGRVQMGWRREFGRDGDSQKAFIPEQKHYDRMIGLGAGYAAIALRNFSKAKLINPYPPVHFWESLAHIINTEPGNVQPTHLVLLKSMLENGVDRFILFFGATAIAALRKSVVELPSRLPAELAEKSATKSLLLLADDWRKDKKFNLP